MKDIKNYEGLYAVTEDGRVWSYKGNKFLVPAQSNGYLFVNLYKENKLKKSYVHRLVATAFIDNPNELSEVNHLSEDKSDNSVKNLAWVSHEENSNYGTRNERISQKLSKPVHCIELDRVFKSVTEAAQQLNMHSPGIFRALAGRTEKAYGYHWRYVNE